MAITYTGSTGLFTQLGKVVKAFNTTGTNATGLNTAVAELYSTFSTAGTGRVTDGLAGSHDSFLSAHESFRSSTASVASSLLATYTSELGIASSSGVLPALISRMITDSQTIDASSVSLSAIAAKGTNAGNGLLFVYTKLDGYSAPSSSVAANPDYNGRLTEVSVTGLITVSCTADRNTGSTLGAEQWSVTGIAAVSYASVSTEGAGGPSSFTSATVSGYIANPGFESFSVSNSPNNWTVESGTTGTNIFENSVTYHRGAKSLRVVGDGSTTIELTQSPSASLYPLRAYFVAVAVKATSVPASGTVQLKFTGTGITSTAPTPKVFDIQISGTPTGGTYTITDSIRGGVATLAYNASSATVQTALRALPGLECVTVSTQAGSVPNITHRVTLYGVQGDASLFTVSVSGLTGGTPAQSVTNVTTGVAGTQVSLPAASLPTAWHVAYFWWHCPASIPTDLKLSLSVTGSLTNAAELFFDTVVLYPPTYFNGVGLIYVPGTTAPVYRDTLTLTVTNDQAGVFQEFFRRVLGVQAPSNAAGAETISDSLAT